MRYHTTLYYTILDWTRFDLPKTKTIVRTKTKIQTEAATTTGPRIRHEQTTPDQNRPDQPVLISQKPKLCSGLSSGSLRLIKVGGSCAGLEDHAAARTGLIMATMISQLSRPISLLVSSLLFSSPLSLSRSLAFSCNVYKSLYIHIERDTYVYIYIYASYVYIGMYSVLYKHVLCYDGCQDITS